MSERSFKWILRQFSGMHPPNRLPKTKNVPRCDKGPKSARISPSSLLAERRNSQSQRRPTCSAGISPASGFAREPHWRSLENLPRSGELSLVSRLEDNPKRRKFGRGANSDGMPPSRGFWKMHRPRRLESWPNFMRDVPCRAALADLQADQHGYPPQFGGYLAG